MELDSLEKRGTLGTFNGQTEHTPVFNTVHIIAAVIGIIGAIAVAVTVLFFCRKRKSNKKLLKMKSDIEQNMIERIPSSRRNDRFGQFASDFDNNVQPPKPVAIHVEDISPTMQQYQLQLKLLEVPTHHRAASSTSTPPPPYQP